jgi:hypothetical protein
MLARWHDGEQLLNNFRSLNFEAFRAFPIFATMKRVFAGILFSSVLATASLRAADAVTLAAQQEAEERYKNLVARIEETQAAQMALEKRISALASDFSKLRDEVARNNTGGATQESIRKLDEQIRKVDESRIADNKRVQEGFEKLEKLIRTMAATPPPRRPESNAGAAAGGNVRPITNTAAGPGVQDGFEYTVQQNDYLGKIVTRLREEKIMVTRKAIEDANPAVEWTKLQVGQKIFIPKPK